jgi:hypothetical protein
MSYWTDMLLKAPDSMSDADKVAAYRVNAAEKERARKAWEEDLLRLELRKQHAARDPADAHRLREYDLSVVEHRKLFIQQNGVCAICREPETASTGEGITKPRALGVDHDHRSGRVRALLCLRCNLAIGHLRESPLLARAVATYLEQQLTKEFTGE